TPERPGEFALRRGAHHFAVGAATTLPGRVPAFLLCRVVSHPDAAGAARSVAAGLGAGSLAAGLSASAVADLAARAGRIRRGYLPDLVRGVDWLDPARGLLFSHRHADQHAGEFAGRTPVRVGIDEQPRELAAGRLVSGRSDSLQPRRLVPDGMHPRLKP